MQNCSLLQTDNHTSTPPLCFLQAGCPSCRSTNSNKALKGNTVLKQYNTLLPKTHFFNFNFLGGSRVNLLDFRPLQSRELVIVCSRISTGFPLHGLLWCYQCRGIVSCQRRCLISGNWCIHVSQMLLELSGNTLRHSRILLEQRQPEPITLRIYAAAATTTRQS